MNRYLDLEENVWITEQMVEVSYAWDNWKLSVVEKWSERKAIVQPMRHWRDLQNQLTHRGRVMHICVSILTIIGSDNGLAPARRQAIVWTYAGILLIRTLGTNFSKILSKIHAFSFKKMHLKILSANWCPFFSASMCLHSWRRSHFDIEPYPNYSVNVPTNVTGPNYAGSYASKMMTIMIDMKSWTWRAWHEKFY